MFANIQYAMFEHTETLCHTVQHTGTGSEDYDTVCGAHLASLLLCIVSVVTTCLSRRAYCAMATACFILSLLRLRFSTARSHRNDARCLRITSFFLPMIS